ncbi:unnamed protein product [Adineta steineri]|uniref:NHL repeat containing protein-like protein n=1 Tax=Adineta steineri TaxID=433720 RepID=A0A814JC29_9BILA|nr:unnamed protein product [Adineta steineri]
MVASNLVAAGTGIYGSAADQISTPLGIFVDVNFDLYVADCGNHRVQLFPPGKSNGITVAGNTSLNPTITLRCPSGIVLDAEKYLFILDSGNHRIVGSGVNGFRCLVGCDGQGSQSNQLYSPFSLSFDSYGNMFVTDTFNHRIQKFLLMKDSSALSFNQPKFCPTATWNPDAITIANQSIVGQWPRAIFMSTNNITYVANRENNTIVMWNEEGVNSAKIIHGSFTGPNSLFVTSNGDIYIDDGQENGRVQKWSAETETFVTVMNVNSECAGLFVDVNDNLYCSLYDEHQVVKRSLNDAVVTSNLVAAGTGFEGSDPNQLLDPRGIFVDVNLDLYVADCGNHRVQLFQSGQLNGITVAGSTSQNSIITLRFPSGIILDAEKNLFILDSGNHRIVGSGVNGFRCLVGCDGTGPQSNELSGPFSFSFDHSRNIFVTDQWNNRIQKFEYLEESCDTSSVVETFYSSVLTSSHPIYPRTGCDFSYYEAIKIRVYKNGYYSFNSISNINTYGYMYAKDFFPFIPSINLIAKDDGSSSNSQFNISIPLEMNTEYILVVTTSNLIETGAFSIYMSGPDRVDLERLIDLDVDTKYILVVTTSHANVTGAFSIIVSGPTKAVLEYTNTSSTSTAFALSFNRPKFCPTATWNSDGITIANQSIAGPYPRAIFVSTNNTIYVANRESKRIVMWQDGSVTPINSILGNFTQPNSLFVTSNGDIYIDDGAFNDRVQKWKAETNTFVIVMTVNSSCSGLFVDIKGTLYCSMSQHHQVVKRSLNDAVMNSNHVAAGTGSLGSDTNQLYGPHGIFVDVNFDLYVADCFNHRVQLLQSGESNGITVAGSTSLNPTVELYYPTGIILDAEKYLFITDQNNNRIVGSSSNGFRCLVGCYGIGSQSNQLNNPFSFSFDHSGNIFVSDSNNDRIQKFKYLEESCVSTLPLVQTTYTSALTTNSSRYLLSCSSSGSYYEAIQVNVRRSGFYTFFGESNMDTYGSIYEDYFNPSNPYENRLLYDDDSCFGRQFRMTIALETGVTYILIVTTRSPYETGAFSIFVAGADNIDLKNISSPSVIQIPYSSAVQSNYSSELTTNSPKYSRDARKSNYYYETIQIHVVETGYYALTSSSNVNTFGYIYKDDFNPRNPSENLLSQDYRSCSYQDFKFIAYLQTGTKYILVVTTSSPNITGKFSILTSGPNVITLNPYRFSFNQPRFCPTALWNSNGIIFANRSIVGEYPHAIFVSTSNTIYAANRENNTIVLWQEESVNPTKIITGSFSQPLSLFVTSNGNIYIDDGDQNGRVQKWMVETNTFVTVMNVNSICFGLFVDIHDTLYCSMTNYHQVVKRSLTDSVMTSNHVAAGTGIRGSASNELDSPFGIFVDVNLDLYVADCRNHRVQLFQSGELNGITVAGSTSLNPTVTLSCPSGIILDAEKYLFIVDQYNNRIVGSGVNGFRCLVGCYGEGSQSNQLSNPSSLSFDSYGNIFVTDVLNNRIQKFQYYKESCDISSTSTSTISSTSKSTSTATAFTTTTKSSYACMMNRPTWMLLIICSIIHLMKKLI